MLSSQRFPLRFAQRFPLRFTQRFPLRFAQRFPLRFAQRFLWLSLAATLACGGGSANIRVGEMPQGGSYHGVWQSPQYGDMHLCVSGSHVVGDYQKDERRGSIQGTIQGDVLRFQWEEKREMVVGRPSITRGRGWFRLKIGQDNDQYIEGAWGHDDAEEGGGPWNAVRMRRGSPERCNNSSGAGGAEDEYDDGYDDAYDDEGDDGGGSQDIGSDSDDSDLEGLDEV